MLKPPAAPNATEGDAVDAPAAPRTLHGVVNAAFRHWRIAALVLALGVAAGVLAAILVPPAYKAQARLLALNAGVYDTQAENGGPNPGQVLNPLDVVNIEIQLLESAELHRAVAERQLGAGATPAAIAARVDRIESALHVTKVTDANVIEMTYVDRDPVVASDTLKTVLDAYFATRAEVLTSGRFGFLSAQLAKVQAQLDAVDRQIVTVQRQNNVVDIAAQIAGAVTQNNELAKARLDTEASLADGRRNIDTLKRNAGAIPRQVELYSDNSEAARSIGEMQSTLLALRARRADFASRYMAGSPQVLQLDKQIGGLETAITRQQRDLVTTRRVGRNEFFDTARDRLVQAEAAAAGNAARRGVIGAQEAASRARLATLIGVSDTLSRLKLQHDILTDSVRSIATRVEQARIQQSQATSVGSTNVRVVEAPSPPDHRSNPAILFLAAGLVAGLALAGIAVVLLASVRTTFLVAEDAARALSLPVLPVGVDAVAARKAWAELAAAVDGDDKSPGATLLLVSPQSRGDLQQVAMGLGTALDRRTPGRVILVRFAEGGTAPPQAAALDIQHWSGIATTVIGTQACVQRGLAAHLLADLRQRYDHVVVTAPPAAASFDGIELSGAVDAVAMVVRADDTTTAQARDLAAAVRDRGGYLLGVVLVGVRDHVPAWLGRRMRETRHVDG